jgi:hypothetical protein
MVTFITSWQGVEVNVTNINQQTEVLLQHWQTQEKKAMC